jgi:hypothetical protein
MSIKIVALITAKKEGEKSRTESLNINFSQMKNKREGLRKMTKERRNVYPKNVLKQGRNVVIF